MNLTKAHNRHRTALLAVFSLLAVLVGGCSGGDSNSGVATYKGVYQMTVTDPQGNPLPTFSGFLDVSADGRVSGQVYVLPLSGTVSETGLVTASATLDPQTSISLEGQILTAGAQKEVNGGSFTIISVGNRQEGIWSASCIRDC